MIAEVPTLIAAINDDGVLGETAFVEVIEHAAEIVIHALHTAKVILYVALVFPFHELLSLQVGFAEGFVFGPVGGFPEFALLGGEVAGAAVELEIVFTEMPRDGHGLFCSG